MPGIFGSDIEYLKFYAVICPVKQINRKTENDMSELVSILVPVYNVEKYLSRCVESALAQTYPDIEIVLVNDGSNDGSAKIMDDYAAKYPSKVRVFHKENEGAAETRKFALGKASGKYIVFIDSDDWIVPNAVQSLYDELIKNDCDIAFGHMVRYVSDSRIYPMYQNCEGVLTQDEFLRQLMKTKSNFSQCAAISKRSIWSDDVFPPKGPRIPSEDIYTNIMLSMNVKRAYVSNKMPVYYYYEPNTTSLTHSIMNRDNFAEWKSFFVQLRKSLAEHHCLEKFENDMRIMEINNLGFFVRNVDLKDEWTKSVLTGKVENLPSKLKVIRFLSRYPKLKWGVVSMNRSLKALLNRKR